MTPSSTICQLNSPRPLRLICLVCTVTAGVLSAPASHLIRELVDHLVRVLREDPHLAQVALGRGVALEAVLVSALLLAHLAVPLELLQPLGLKVVMHTGLPCVSLSRSA